MSAISARGGPISFGNPETIILGIDPGTHFMGVGCIAKSGNRLRLVSTEVLTASSRGNVQERLTAIWPQLREAIRRISPHVIALEDIFHAKNAKSAFHVGLARGLVFACAIEEKIPIFEYAPTRVKSSVTGSGRADKEQVKRMTERLLGCRVNLRHDATDALAIAICHATASNLTQRMMTQPDKNVTKR